MADINKHQNFISASSIKTITIDVTEEINQNFLKDFIRTTLETNNITIDNDTYISYNFIQNNSLYEIYIIHSSLDNITIAPDILTIFYKNKDTKSIDLFILKDFFVIYKKEELYSFKYFKESSEYEDIKSYVTQTYKLKLDNIYKIDEDKFNQLKLLHSNQNSTTKKSSFNKLKKNNSFFVFTIFTFISIIIFLIFSYSTYTNTQDTLLSKLTTVKNKYQQIKQKQHSQSEPVNHNKISSKLIELFKYIKLENLTTQKISYESKIVSLALLHIKKDKLLNFLTIYPTNTTIESIKFLQEQEIYKMVIKIET